jgi:hypothetical protein
MADDINIPLRQLASVAFGAVSGAVLNGIYIAASYDLEK